ncbi:MAG: threonyl-tRNA synthetase [Trizodia sp. TS-e1964]|nr:MAG: threonyl-tRNA synthetase [Trizodia sp. TS-e1964]
MDTVNAVVDGLKNAALGDKSKQKSKKPPKEKNEAANTKAALELNPPPEYIQHRIDIFEKHKQLHDSNIAQQPRADISINVIGHSALSGQSWFTSPARLLKDLDGMKGRNVVVAKVDGKLWDLGRPLEKSCSVEYLEFDHPEGKQVFWHSSAHILGEACERRYGCHLCHGPPGESGFYYDMGMPNQESVHEADWALLEKLSLQVTKEKQQFERLELPKEVLKEMFSHNKYKLHFIQDKIPDGTSSTVYRCGPLIDLCLGPHIPHTGLVKAFTVNKSSASYFLGDQANDSLQRVYGVSFPTKKEMDEHLIYLKEAAERDHRKIGKEQELFAFDEVSPGSPFFLPHGTIIINALFAFLRQEYWKRGYKEIQTPTMFNVDLWKQSGHYQHYKDDMFLLNVEEKEWALKPMNCPGHCKLFGFRERSYRELPMRWADFGVLHRNEASGALTGLTRVRRFQQDDSHIFCTQDQIGDEIKALFDFLNYVYGIFGFSFKMKLSTRPDKYLGELKTWDMAEEKLRQALDGFTAAGGAKWELNEGDGAFYGPKIDITISDAIGRQHQCATIQLDFQLPQNFDLQYVTGEKTGPSAKSETAAAPAEPMPTAPASSEKPKDAPNPKAPRKDPLPGYARPVMIHRAIFGSFERIFAILVEHYAGKWPFWLSPRQVLVVPTFATVNEYAHDVHSVLREHGLHADVDVSGETLKKKLRTGQLQGYNFICVVGPGEEKGRTVNVWNRDDQASQDRNEPVTLNAAVAGFKALRDSRSLSNMAVKFPAA